MHEQDITRRQPGHHLSQMERGRIAELYATGTSKRELLPKLASAIKPSIMRLTEGLPSRLSALMAN